MQEPFKWDYNSDQPYQLKDRSYKKQMRKRVRFSILKTALISLFVLPLSLLVRTFIRNRDIDSRKFFAMSVNLDREPKESIKMIQELGVESVLIRMPLWDMDRLSEYEKFCLEFSDREITVNIMQDREHIEDLQLLRDDLSKIFNSLGKYSKRFQIATTINRAKWGFFGVDEYLGFYKTAYDLRGEKFKDLELIGPSVIDFEFHFTAHALFNMRKIFFDGLSALLYVDRRGAPENRQMGFSLLDKIRLQRSMMMLSPKVGDRFYITETNWPISDTAPFAPTSEHECVSEEEYGVFMLRYYLLAFASREVESVFWHQLIASGYGLVDARDSLRKRLAYEVFKTMIKHLGGSDFISFENTRGLYTLTCNSDLGRVSVLWSMKGEKISFSKPCVIYGFDGKKELVSEIIVDEKPVYIYAKGDL